METQNKSKNKLISPKGVGTCYKYIYSKYINKNFKGNVYPNKRLFFQTNLS